MPANLRPHSNRSFGKSEQPVLYVSLELGWDSWKLAEQLALRIMRAFLMIWPPLERPGEERLGVSGYNRDMKPDSGQLAATDDEPALRDKFMHNAFWISFWLVFAVPSAAFSAASTGSHGTSQNVVVGVASWLGAGFASVAAVVCATVLMISSRPQRKHW